MMSATKKSNKAASNDRIGNSPDDIGNSPDDIGNLPDEEVARIVSELKRIVALMRHASMTRLISRNPKSLSFLMPSRIERAILIGLAQTYGQSILKDPRFYPVMSFVAERGGVALVREVLFGLSDGCSTAEATFRNALSTLLQEARPAFEFLCSTWPEIFMAQANAALRRLGLPACSRPWSAGTSPHRRPSEGGSNAG